MGPATGFYLRASTKVCPHVFIVKAQRLYAAEPSLRSGFLGLEVVRVPAPIGLTML